MFSRPEGIEKTRIWIDGCFDFAHHGAMLQARQLGRELFVGVHSDEEILLNKGPTVMRLPERIKAVDACKWSTEAVPDAPYVTDPEFMKKYNCLYVVHGDDITTDANGNDCYQEVKDRGLFVVVKRTPNILTTDLVGRMLLMTLLHHYATYKGSNTLTEHRHPLFDNLDNLERFKLYATDQSGLNPGSGVYVHTLTGRPLRELVAPSTKMTELYSKGVFYIDGGFDLFHPGHIEALRLVKERANDEGLALVVGIHDDYTANEEKGLNYPIMNLFERSLCVLQCKYVDALVLQAPFTPSNAFLKSLPGPIKGVFNASSDIKDSSGLDPYAEAKESGIFHAIGPHEYDEINTEFIVKRVLDNKAAYEERQRKKGWKAEHEVKLREAEKIREQAGLK